MQKLADEMAIRNLVARLAMLADMGPDDFREYLSLWTENGIYDVKEPVRFKQGNPSQAKKVSGHAELIADRRMLRAIGFQGPGTDVWHLNTTLWVRVPGVDEAESLWVLAMARASPVSAASAIITTGSARRPMAGSSLTGR